MKLQKRLNIIGGGRVGTVLGHLFHSSRVFEIGDVLGRSMASAADAVHFIGAGRPICSLTEVTPAPCWMVTVPDDSLCDVVRDVALSGRLRSGDVVFHCSGSRSSSALMTDVGTTSVPPGVICASVHPAQSFADRELAIRSFPGTICAFEGDTSAEHQLSEVFTKIGGTVISISSNNKMAYHAAFVLVSNYVVTLTSLAQKLHAVAGISKEQSITILAPLMRGTVENIVHVGPERALTGPIARGDLAGVIAQHYAVAASDAEIGEVYRLLGVMTAQLALKSAGGDKISMPATTTTTTEGEATDANSLKTRLTSILDALTSGKYVVSLGALDGGTTHLASKNHLIDLVRKAHLFDSPQAHTVPVSNEIELVELAIRHRVIPSVISVGGQPVSENARGLSTAHLSRTAQHQLLLRATLETLHEIIVCRGISYVLFKGFGLQERCYGKALRVFNDLDIVIDRVDLPDLHSALVAQGWRRNVPHFYEDTVVYVSSNGVELDVHTNLQDTHVAPTISFADLERRATKSAQLPCRVLGDTDQMIGIILHAFKHQWCRLQWILDIALLARSMSSEDLDTLSKEATEAKISPIVDVAFGLVAATLDPDIFTRYSRGRAPDKAQQRRVAVHLSRLFQDVPNTLLNKARSAQLHLELLSGSEARCRYLLRRTILGVRRRLSR